MRLRIVQQIQFTIKGLLQQYYAATEQDPKGFRDTIRHAMAC